MSSMDLELQSGPPPQLGLGESPHPACGQPLPSDGRGASPTPEGEEKRLAVQTVELLHRVLAGDGLSEGMILRFIGDQWGATSLFYLPRKVAIEALRRPADFLRAAKNHCEPELPF